MLVELRAGMEVDLASGRELREQTAALASRLDALNRGPITEIVTDTVTTTAAGAIGDVTGAGASTVLYRVPQGFSARINRWAVTAAGFTPAAPLTTGYMAFYRDSPTPTGLALFLPISGVVAPVVIVEGLHDAVYLRDGGSLVVVGAALPATLTFGFSFQVTLYSAATAPPTPSFEGPA